jgi:hypothetical protein
VHSYYFPFFEVQDFKVGICRDAKQGGRWLKSNWLVKTGLKIPNWPVHDDHRRTCVHANDTAKPAGQSDDIAGMEPERMLQGLPDDANELGLRRVVEMDSGVFHKASFKRLGWVCSKT